MLLQTQEAQVASEVSSSQYSTRVPVLVPVLVPVPPVLVLPASTTSTGTSLVAVQYY
jgi:hypothetical protein